ncbi:MAG TPA: plastocyanin/azurin family copper-binding protein [Acidimicrobiia bacterium]|nr:plastocyanin/azurin family copper-binding protein [Acidimicrobiia bacterium]
MFAARKLLWLAIPTVMVLFVTACGDDDGDQGGGATEFDVAASEFQFSPDAWAVAADTDVTVTFSNAGSIPHEWAVLTEGTNIESEAEFTEDLVELEVEALPAGESTTQSFNLPAGTYQVICALEGHFNAGMEGTLSVGG